MSRPSARTAVSIVVALLLALAVPRADGRTEAAHALRIAPSAASACAQASAAQTANRAGLVVTFGVGDTRTYCIEFEEESISGLELLQRSGLPLVTAASGGLGGAVCKVDSVGCDNPSNCFCQCAGSPCSYWAYYTLADGTWTASPVGASTRVVRNGDVDGWAWGSGGSGGQPAVSGGICPTPAPTATQPPAATPAPASTTVPPEAAATAQPATAQPPSTAEAPPTAPVMPALPRSPRTQPASGVLGATHVPATSTPAALAATPAITPRTGAIIGADEGLANAARSNRRASGGGGRDPLPALLASAGVVLALAGTAALITYRRRRMDG